MTDTTTMLDDEAERTRAETEAATLPALALDAAGLAALELMLDGALRPLDGFRLEPHGELPALPLHLDGTDAAPGTRLALHDPEGVTLGIVDITGVGESRGRAVAAGPVRGIRAPQRDLFAHWRRPLAMVREALAGCGPGEALCVTMRGEPDDTDAAALARAGSQGPVLLRVMDPDDPDRAHHVKARLTAAQRVAATVGARRCVIAVCADPAPAPGPLQQALDRLYATNAGCAHLIGVAARTLPAADGGVCVFFTGLSGSGKSTVARAVHARLVERSGRGVTLLDGDVVRRHLTRGLGFSRADRDTNVLRIGYVASRVVMHGGLVVCAPIAPYAGTRAAVREMVEAHGRFLEVHVSTPIEVCEARDRKGLYAKARAGVIKEFTGVSDPYEAPAAPELRIDTSQLSLDEAVDRVIAVLDER